MGKIDHKAFQSRKKKGYYEVQWSRTRRNKISRLLKRIDFDPTAEPAIKRLDAQKGRGQ